MTSNDTTHESSEALSAPATKAGRSGIDAFYDAVRGWGAVRGSERWFAGVAGALGRKFGLDPLVVRIAFVVLTFFGGIGLLLYGIGWALLPDAAGRIEAEAAKHGDVSPSLIGAGVLVVLDLVLGNGLLGLGWIF